MSETLKYVAWFIFVAAGLGGAVLASADGDFYYSIALPYWIGGAITGIMFLALALILEYVQEMHKKVFGIDVKSEFIPQTETPAEPPSINS